MSPTASAMPWPGLTKKAGVRLTKTGERTTYAGTSPGTPLRDPELWILCAGSYSPCYGILPCFFRQYSREAEGAYFFLLPAVV